MIFLEMRTEENVIENVPMLKKKTYGALCF